MRSPFLRSVLLLLLGWSLLTASALQGFAGTHHRLVLETAHGHSPFSPTGEEDKGCDRSTSDLFGEEHENPENSPPVGASFLPVATCRRVSVPYLRSVPSEVYLDRFIPPQIRS